MKSHITRIDTPFGQTAVVNDDKIFDRARRQTSGELEGRNVYGLKQYDESLERWRANGFKGIVIGLKNGNAFVDGGLKVKGADGTWRTFMCLGVFCDDDKAYDTINGYEGMDMYEYIDMLKEWNPRLRMDTTMPQGTPWSDKCADLMNYLAVRR